MSVSAWPSTLPQALFLAGYSGTFPNVMIKSDMDAGPPKVRRRLTANIEPVMGKVILSTAQLATFTTFFNDTLAGGSLRFSWTKPPAHSIACEMRFSEAPTYTKVSDDDFEMSMSLEVLP
jgi:hypothetical protein